MSQPDSNSLLRRNVMLTQFYSNRNKVAEQERAELTPIKPINDPYEAISPISDHHQSQANNKSHNQSKYPSNQSEVPTVSSPVISSEEKATFSNDDPTRRS